MIDYKIILKLGISFLKIGSIAFGGGYAVIPLLQREVVEARQWVTAEELADMMAISQTLPGIIMVNSATMIGYRVGGFWGGLIATIAAIVPTFVITLLVTMFFWKYTDNPWIRKTLTGILLGVTTLIIYSITKTWRSVIRNSFDLALVIISAISLVVFKINVVMVILGTAFLGYFYHLVLIKKGGKTL